MAALIPSTSGPHSLGKYAPTLQLNNLAIVGADQLIYMSTPHVVLQCPAVRSVVAIHTNNGHDVEEEVMLVTAVPLPRLPCNIPPHAIVTCRRHRVEVLLDCSVAATCSYLEAFGSSSASSSSLTCVAAARCGDVLCVMMGNAAGVVQWANYEWDGATLRAQPRTTATTTTSPHAPHGVVAMDVDLETTTAVMSASGDVCGRLVCWSTDQRVLLQLPPTDASVESITAVRLIEGGATVVASFGCGKVRVVDVVHGAITAEINAHSRWIVGMCACASRRLLATTSDDGRVQVWSVRGGGVEMVAAADLASGSSPTGVAMLHDGRVWVVCYDDDVAQVFHVPPHLLLTT